MNIHAPELATERERVKARDVIKRLYAQAEQHFAEMERKHAMILRIVEASGLDLREALGDAPVVVVPVQRAPMRDRTIAVMWRQGKLTAPQYLAAERIAALVRLKERTQKVASWANGAGGGGSADAVSDGLARALDAASEWGMLQARILMDVRCGADIEHRRRVFAVLELACGAEMSARAIVRERRDLGNPREVTRKLKTGLQVVAESLGDLKRHREDANAACDSEVQS